MTLQHLPKFIFWIGFILSQTLLLCSFPTICSNNQGLLDTYDLQLIFVNTFFVRGNVRLIYMEMGKKTFLVYCILNYPVYLVAEKEERNHWIRVWTTYETLEK